MDQRDVHAADEAHGAGFRRLRRHDPGQIAALFLGKDDRLDVGLFHHHVDDGELGIGVIRGNLVQHVAKGESGHHDGVGARLGQAAERLFTLRLGLHFQFLVGAAGFLGPALRAGEGRLVEGLVELAAKVEDQRRFGQGRSARQCRQRHARKQRFRQGHKETSSCCCARFKPPA